MTIKWYKAKFVSTKPKTSSESGGRVAQAGAPWTLDAWGTSGSRAALVFLYWPDVKDRRGYLSQKWNNEVWLDPDLTCSARAFDCYCVDAKEAPADALAFYRVDATPVVLILDYNRKCVASLSRYVLTRDVLAFLEDTLHAKFPERWNEYQAALKQIAQYYAEARDALQKQDDQTAHNRLTWVVESEFRTRDYPRQRDLLAKLNKRLGVPQKK